MKPAWSSKLRLSLGVISIILCSSLSTPAQVTVTGVVRAEQEVAVQSEVAGVVERIAVQEGQHVEEGQLLVELRNERQKITLELSRTGLAKANALVEETRILLNNAEKQLNRIQVAADALPRKEREDLEDQVQRLKASLNAQTAERARRRRSTLKGTRTERDPAGGTFHRDRN